MTNEQKTILTYDATQIAELVPHRYPFLLVDRITECVPGEYAIGYKNLTWNEEFFQGLVVRRLCRFCSLKLSNYNK